MFLYTTWCEGRRLVTGGAAGGVASVNNDTLVRNVVVENPGHAAIYIHATPSGVCDRSVDVGAVPSGYGLFGLPFLEKVTNLVSSVQLSCGTLVLSTSGTVRSARVRRRPSGFRGQLSSGFNSGLIGIVVMVTSVLNITLTIKLFFFIPSFLFSLDTGIIPTFGNSNKGTIF